MRLLHVTPYFAPAWAYGGVARAVTGLARAQARAGHEVVVLTTDALTRTARTPVTEETLDGVRVVRVRNLSHRLRADFNLSTPVGFAAVARRLIVGHRVEIVHGHELRTVENLHVARVLDDPGPRFVVSPHGTLPYETGRGVMKRTWDRLLGSRVLRRVDQVVALTFHEAQQARRLWADRGVPLATRQVAVVPNGVDADAFAHTPDPRPFRERWGLDAGPVVLFLGRLAARKGLVFLLDVFDGLAAALPEARLLVAGPDEGMMKTLQATVEERRLQDRVAFTGLLDDVDTLGALSVADVLALPATGEGFSVAVLEAMACGRPVVLSPDCHFHEVASRGAGLVVPLAVGAWAAALRALLTDPDRRASMGERARHLIAHDYAWPIIAARLERVYDAALSRTR